MIGREFFRGVLRQAQRLRPYIPFGPDKGDSLPLEVLRGRPPHSSPAQREGTPRFGAQATASPSRRKGFLANDVGISMYLGTRGGRGR